MVCLVRPQNKLDKRIGAYDLIGPEVLERVNDIFGNSANNQEIIAELNKLLTETGDLVKRSEDLIKNLNLVPEEESSDTKLVELSLEGNSSLTNFWDMEKRAADLKLIVRACSRVANQSFETVKITSVNSASPQIGIYIEALRTTSEVIIALSICAGALRKLKDSLWDKKKKLQSLGLPKKELKLSTKALEVQHDNGYKEKRREFSVKLVKEYGLKKEDHELENLVDKALDRLTDLMGDETRILDPKQIKPTSDLPDRSLPKIYGEIKKLKEPHQQLLIAENNRKLGLRKKKMLEDVEGKKSKQSK